MNEPIIHDSTPNGSIILAYGEASRPNKFSTMLLALPGLVLLLIVTFALRTLFSATLPVPQGVALLAYVSPSASLPVDSPTLWLDTERAAKPMPFFVGLTVDERGDRHPFAIGARNFGVEKKQVSGFWQLIQEEETTYDKRTPRSVAGAWKDYFSPMWLRVWPSRLLPNAGLTTESDQSFGGRVRAGRWMTDLPAPSGVTDRDRINGQNFLNVRSLPLAWTLLEPTVRVHDLDLNLNTLPSAAHWSLDETLQLSLSLDFDEPLKAEEKAELAGSIGLFDLASYTLPDGTVVTENRLPFTALDQATTTEWTLDDGRKAIFQEKAVFLGNPALFMEEQALPENCKGHVLAAFDDLGSRNLFDALGFAYLPSRERIVLLEADGKIVACW